MSVLDNCLLTRDDYQMYQEVGKNIFVESASSAHKSESCLKNIGWNIVNMAETSRLHGKGTMTQLVI